MPKTILFCDDCGVPLSASRRCNNCGDQISELHAIVGTFEDSQAEALLELHNLTISDTIEGGA